MSSLKTLFIGVLLIALVYGQFELDSVVPGNIEEDDNDQDEEVTYQNNAQNSQAFYKIIPEKLAQFGEPVAEPTSELNGSINGHKDKPGDDSVYGIGTQDKNGISIHVNLPSSDHGNSMQRRKRSIRKKLKKIGKKAARIVKKAGRICKQVLDKCIPIVIGAGGLL